MVVRVVMVLDHWRRRRWWCYEIRRWILSDALFLVDTVLERRKGDGLVRRLGVREPSDHSVVISASAHRCLIVFELLLPALGTSRSRRLPGIRCAALSVRTIIIRIREGQH